MSSALVWQIVKGNHAFVRKGLNGVVFSAEAGNVYNKNSYKCSGLANTNHVDISVDAKADAVKFGLGSRKNAQKPKKNTARFTVKQNARRALQSVGKQVASFRPDLKKGAVARMAAIQKSLRVKKATKA
uniref:Ribosomal eL28/Mak16 domain-containing protein n=1 Tax=Chlamydomonas leiostraca TaxID=1034604 RepID=A0A7S0WY90_9CHLO